MSKSYIVRENPDGTRYFDENTPTGQISPDTIGAGLKIDADGKVEVDAAAIDGVVHTTGVETIAGNKSFTNPIALKRTDSGPVVFVDNIQNDQYRDIMASKDGGGRISFIRFTKSSSANSVAMYSCKADSGLGGSITVTTDANDVTTTSAPTPPLADKSTQIATTAWVKNILPSTNGFKVNSDGTVSVDFSSMSQTDKDALFKELKLPIWLTGNTNFYVNGTTGSDTLDDGRGLTADKPFKTIQACVNYVTSTYNLVNYNAVINVAAGTYSVGNLLTLGGYNSTTGMITIRGAGSGSTILTYSGLGTALRVLGGSTWRFIDISFVHNIQQRSTSISCFSVSSNSTLFLSGGCNFTVNNTAPASGTPAIYLFNVASGCNLTIDGSLNIGVVSPVTDNSRLHVFQIAGDFYINKASTAYTLDIQTPANMPGTRTLIMQQRGFGTITGAGQYPWPIITGNVTGKRYEITGGSAFDSGGLGTEILPGTVAGTVETSTYSWYK